VKEHNPNLEKKYVQNGGVELDHGRGGRRGSQPHPALRSLTIVGVEEIDHGRR
jgi:hypothetical protein